MVERGGLTSLGVGETGMLACAGDEVHRTGACTSSNIDAVIFAAYGSSRVGVADSVFAPIVQAVAAATAPLPCDLAYTSMPVVRALTRRGAPAPLLEDVLTRLRDTGCKRVAIQPGFISDGWALFDLVRRASDLFEGDVLAGAPLLASVADAAALARALHERHPRRAGSACVFVAHGESWPEGQEPPASRNSFDALAALRAAFLEFGRTDVLVFTMRDAPTVPEKVRALGAVSVRIVPLMLVAGHHVEHQLFGADPQSFASRLAEAGIEVEAIDEGLGALPAVRELFSDHACALCRHPATARGSAGAMTLRSPLAL